MALYTTCSYNVDIAKSFGPISAIYISMLDNFRSFIESDDIILTRQQIYAFTGIDVTKQKEAEDFLVKLNIITIKGIRGNCDKNHYFLNYETINNIKDNPVVIKDLVVAPIKDYAKKKKTTKKEQTIIQLKKAIQLEDPVVKQYACDWVDAVMETNFMTLQGLKLNIEELKKFSTEQGSQIEVLKIAIKNSWRDLSWAMAKVPQSINTGNNFAKYEDIRGTKDNLIDEAF